MWSKLDKLGLQKSADSRFSLCKDGVRMDAKNRTRVLDSGETCNEHRTSRALKLSTENIAVYPEKVQTDGTQEPESHSEDSGSRSKAS